MSRVRFPWDPGHAAYWLMLIAFLLLILVAAMNGWWIYAAVAVPFVGLIAFAGRFVLYRRWRPEPPPRPLPTRRPVVRRRR